MTKEECIAAFEPTKQEVILVELDWVPEAVKKITRNDGKVVTLYRTEQRRSAQQNQAESGRIVQKYKLAEGEEPESPIFSRFSVGDRVTFMDYVCPQGPFQAFPQLRVMSLNEIMGKLNTDETIVE